MKKIFIAGITGSIGTQTVEVIKKLGPEYKIVGGSVNINFEKAKKIIDENNIEYFYVNKKDFKENYYGKCKIYSGDSFEEVLSLCKADMLILATSGAAGIKHSFAAVRNSKRVCLANKETIVCSGSIFTDYAKNNNSEIIPVDSEHSAIFQLLDGEKNSPEKIILTASGGSLRDRNYKELDNITVEEVLNHPVWSMGKRITVDSATMLNKGLEVIEAYEFFNTENIEVYINRNSIVHSMIAFKDGTVKMHYGIPDMKVPIAYSITYPERKYNYRIPDFTENPVAFQNVDFLKAPLLKTAFEIMKNLSMRIAYNASDEIAVEGFIKKEIPYKKIFSIVNKTVEYIGSKSFKIASLDDILYIDDLSRKKAKEFIKE